MYCACDSIFDTDTNEGCMCNGADTNDSNDTARIVHGISSLSVIQPSVFQLVVSTAMMEVLLAATEIQREQSDLWSSMLDTGATVTLIPTECAAQLQLQIMPHTDGRRVGTADQKGSLAIQGWVDLPGYIGRVAVCSAVKFIIIAACQLQANGLGMDIRPDTSICELYTTEGSFAILEQCVTTHLYYIDLRLLMNTPASLSTVLLEGCTLDSTYQVLSVSTSVEKRRKPSGSLSFRVFRFHRRFKHVPFSTLSRMLRNGLIIRADVTADEVDLVSSHQECMPCALARWKKLNETPSSGLRPLRPGQTWSSDYQGPYAVEAVGGFTGMFTFVCLSTGYGVVFLVRSKMEHFICVQKIDTLCNRWGHMFEVLRVDAGSVEASDLFIEKCATIHGLGKPGIQVRPANVGMQEQNPVERYVQTAQNMMAAMMVAQDLLPASFWGWSAISAWKTLNCISNSLCPESTPIFEFENGKVVDASKMFRHAFGQAVISTRMNPKEHGIGDTRNEFGVVVCPGDPFNGSDLVYLPERGKHNVVVQRYNLRDLELGSKEQLTLEARKKYLSVVGDDTFKSTG